MGHSHMYHDTRSKAFICVLVCEALLTLLMEPTVVFIGHGEDFVHQAKSWAGDDNVCHRAIGSTQERQELAGIEERRILNVRLPAIFR